MKEKTAKTIRVISIPPVMVTAMLLIIYYMKHTVFRSISEIVILIFLLGIFPVLAYPLHRIIPALYKKGRSAQRKMAFIFTFIGYTGAFLWGLISKAGPEIILICSTYFFTVIFLTILNLFSIKASGHAGSFTAPLLILAYLIDWKFIFPCLAIALLISWSSVHLKRHTIQQLIYGAAVCILAFSTSILLNSIIKL